MDLKNVAFILEGGMTFLNGAAMTLSSGSDKRRAIYCIKSLFLLV
ncbi:MAG: hypothetical protein V1698_00265 [bacterium]